MFAQNKSAVLLGADTKSVVRRVSGSSLHRRIVIMASKTVRAPRLILVTKRLNTTHSYDKVKTIEYNKSTAHNDENKVMQNN